MDVHTYKWGGRPHYSYPIMHSHAGPDGCLVLHGVYGRQLIHHTRGETYHIPNTGVEFVWPGRWFAVAADLRDGQLHGYYCNIIAPATISTDRIEWVDLDLDVIVKPDLTWTLVDEDEFEEHRIAYGYPVEVAEGARRAVDELVALIESRAFPFDGGWLNDQAIS